MMELFGFKKGNGEFTLRLLTRITHKSLEFHTIMMGNQLFNSLQTILRELRFKMTNN